MANYIETIYKNKNILYESFKPETGVILITVSWWEETPENYENYNKFRHRILHSKWLESNSIFYPLVLITAQDEATQQAIYARKRVNTERFYTDYQITLKLREVEIKYYKAHEDKMNPLMTFRANIPIVQEQFEKWVDMMFDCDYAPVTFLKKKE